MNLYSHIIRPLLFKLDSEKAHELAIGLAQVVQDIPGALSLVRALYSVSDPRLSSTVGGVTFPNPVGLAAGMDKQGVAVDFFDAIGFGALEIGSVTQHAQPGNPRPRMFRLIDDRALINRMGFPSVGCDVMVQTLRELSQHHRASRLGINLGKSKCTELDKATEDYLYSFNRLKQYGDYFVINVSSPNTPELRKLQERSRLLELFTELQKHNDARKPLFVKVAPDLESHELDEIIDVVQRAQVSGIIATNTTVTRNGLRTPCTESGGLSGEPLRARSLEVVSAIYKKTGGALPIIGVGGVTSAADALAFFAAGASAIQIYSSLVYQGAGVVAAINRGIIEELNRRQISSLEILINELRKA